MGCKKPLSAWRSVKPSPKGGLGITFKRSEAYLDLPLKVPCGRCIGCRLEHSRQWAIRCCHEAMLHQDNCFITLTYNDENLPDDNSLDYRHYVLFMKRLRKKYGDNIRFYMCGEYGEVNRRPHYHACMFNFDPPDKTLWKVVGKNNNIRLYVSEELNKIWGKGYCVIGDVTFESAAYVARYVMKKVTGDKAEEHYICEETGCVLKPEFTNMSRRPGIGKDFFDKYKSDIYPNDRVILREKKMRPPKYYDYLLEAENIDQYQQVKNERRRKGAKQKKNQTPERLKVSEKILEAKLKLLKRNL